MVQNIWQSSKIGQKKYWQISRWEEILLLISNKLELKQRYWWFVLFCHFFDLTLTSWPRLDQILVSIFSGLDEVSGLVPSGLQHQLDQKQLEPPASCAARHRRRTDQAKPIVTWVQLHRLRSPEHSAEWQRSLRWCYRSSLNSAGSRKQRSQQNAGTDRWKTTCWHSDEQKLSRNKEMQLLTAAGMLFCLIIYLLRTHISFSPCEGYSSWAPYEN